MALDGIAKKMVDLGDKATSAKKKIKSAAEFAANPIDSTKDAMKSSMARYREQQELDEEVRKRFQKELEQSERESRVRNSMGMGTTAAGPALGAAAGAAIASNNNRDAEKRLLEKQTRAQDKTSKAAEDASKKLNDLRSGGSAKSDVNTGWLTLIIILAIIAHLFDAFSNPAFYRPPNTIVLSFYCLIIVVMFFFVTKMKVTNEDTTLVAVIAVVMVFPWLMELLTKTINSPWLLTITGLMVFFPPLVLYLFLQYPEHSIGAKIIKIYFFIWIIIGILYLVTSPAVKAATNNGQGLQVDVLESVKYVGNGIWGLSDKFTKSISDAYAKNVALATGQQYEGDQESQVGIFLKDFKPLEKTYYSTSDIWLEAKITAQNIKDEVVIRNSCNVVDKNIRGTVTPYVLNMTNNDENVLDCHIGSLTPGVYEVKLTSTFQFQTDAEIKYYFVDAGIKPETYSKAKIPDKSIAIYTGGPVAVGLPSLHQPLRIDPNAADDALGNYPYGVSFTNNWVQGHINRGISYTLEVPSAVQLVNCTRKQSGPMISENDRNKYFFSISDINARTSFDSVTCRMKIINPSQLLGSNLESPPERTFSANVVYEYTIEESATLIVQKDFTPINP